MKLLAPALMVLMAAQAVAAETWRKVGTVKGFEGMRAELQHLADRHTEVKARASRFCMVVQDPDNPKDDLGPVAWVYWPQGGWMYAFTPTNYPPVDDSSMWGSGTIELRHDVVASEKNFKFSTSRRTSAYVNNIISHCASNGETVMIEKHHG